jgi:hypothetical protein
VFCPADPPDRAGAYARQDTLNQNAEVSVMTRTLHRQLLIGGLLATAAGLAGSGAFAQARMGNGFATYDNDKHGFSLVYPATQFVALPVATQDGFQAVSKDGKARLLVGTIGNFDGKTLADYRKFLLNASYAGASVTYAPVRDTWFVVSGVRSDGVTGFYQRVNFVCGGRNINSWAVIFPFNEKPTYSAIIEQVHRDYVLGDGNCAKTAMMKPAMQPKAMGGPDARMQTKQMGEMERIMTGAMEPEMPPKQMAAMEPPAMPAKQMAAKDPALPKQMVAMASQMPPRDMPKDTGNMSMGAGSATYSNDKHGFSMIYPAGQFLALPAATPDLFQAVSKDGKARLQAGTVANFDGKSLGAYRSFLLDAAYADAKLGDAPMLAKGFVVSGVKSDGTTAFYHRVNFVCGWRNINSWSILYPAQEQAAYAKVIEQIDRDYAVGDGNCDKTAMK